MAVVKWTKEMEAEARAMYAKLASEPSPMPSPRKAPPNGFVWVRSIPGGGYHLEKESAILEQKKRNEAALREIKRTGAKVRVIL